RPDGFDGFKDRLSLEQHALGSTEGAVVDGAMAIVGPGAEGVDQDVDLPCLAGFLDDAVVEGATEEVGEDGDNVKFHAWLGVNTQCTPALTGLYRLTNRAGLLGDQHR